MHLLIVEDEPEMLTMLCEGLREHGHTATPAANGEAGLRLAKGERFDVILLDILLPGLNGYTLARLLRKAEDAPSRHTPILMLTACDSEDQVIQGLELGADYYMTKPFSFLELLARIKSIRRHTALPRTYSCLRVADLVFDPESQTVRRGGRTIELTRTERGLLLCLLRSTGSTVSRHDLMTEVWGDEGRVGSSTLDAFMNLLRNKVDAPFENKLIHTRRGTGYCIFSTTESVALPVEAIA